MVLSRVLENPPRAGGCGQRAEAMPCWVSAHRAFTFPGHKAPSPSPVCLAVIPLEARPRGASPDGKAERDGRKGGEGRPRHRQGALPPLPSDGLSLIPGREAGTAAVEEEDYEEREIAWKQPCFTPSFPTEAVLGICLWEGEAKACGAQGETAAEEGTCCSAAPCAPTAPLAPSRQRGGCGVRPCKARAKGCNPFC